MWKRSTNTKQSSKLAEDLKNVLDNMSQEQFDREWSKIVSYGFPNVSILNNMNTIQNKKSFKISLFNSCPIYGKLKIDKENKGYLKYYDKFGEITVDLDNYNKLIIESIINQAEVICLMKSATLWSY